MSRATRVFASVLLGAACLSARAADATSSADREVFSIVGRELCLRIKASYEILDDRASSQSAPTLAPDIDTAALKQAIERSHDGPSLPSGIGCSKLRVTDSALIQKIFKSTDSDVTGGWPKFHTAFPGATGLTQLSLPGYAEEGTVAVVIVSGYCGDLCGAGFIWQLRKTQDHWVLDKIRGAWIS